MLKIPKKLLKNYAMKSTNTDKISQKVAEILFDIGAITFRPKQPFRYDSGILSPVYTDNRLLISYPKERSRVEKFLISKIKEIGIPDVVAGVATAGIPHSAFIAQSLNLPMAYIRFSPKDHGKGNQVEGVIHRGQKVIVVEDLISTAGSTSRSAEALRAVGAKVENAVALFTYNLKESEENLKKAKIKLHALTNLKEVAEVALKKGFLKIEQVTAIIEWSKQPRDWAKKMGFT